MEAGQAVGEGTSPSDSPVTRSGSLQSPMTSHQTVLGACPACETPIPSGRLLIEYRTDGRREMFAECPSCRDVVHPR